jgi:hypothetical protein
VKRTELREQFFAEARADPWTHMLAKMLADMWAEGYREAIRDRGEVDERSFKYRHDQALKWMTDMQRKSEAQFVIAMAAAGPFISHPDLAALSGEQP